MASGEHDAALSDDSIEARRQRRQIGIESGDRRRVSDLFFGCAINTERDVFRKGHAEQKGLLRHDTHQRSQSRQRKFAAIHAVKRDAALTRIERARQQLDQRALARSSFAENG